MRRSGSWRRCSWLMTISVASRSAFTTNRMFRKPVRERTTWLGCAVMCPRHAELIWLADTLPPRLPRITCGSGTKPARRFA